MCCKLHGTGPLLMCWQLHDTCVRRQPVDSRPQLPFRGSGSLAGLSLAMVDDGESDSSRTQLLEQRAHCKGSPLPERKGYRTHSLTQQEPLSCSPQAYTSDLRVRSRDPTQVLSRHVCAYGSCHAIELTALTTRSDTCLCTGVMFTEARAVAQQRIRSCAT